ncbi:MAG: hypothetical protein NVSMB32_17950 [Actinomycetota bacterium]
MPSRQPVRQEWRWFLGLLTKDAAGALATVHTVDIEGGDGVHTLITLQGRPTPPIE